MYIVVRMTQELENISLKLTENFIFRPFRLALL